MLSANGVIRKKYRHWFDTKQDAKRILKRLVELTKKYPGRVTLADMRAMSGARSISSNADEIILVRPEAWYIEKRVEYRPDDIKIKQYCVTVLGKTIEE